MQATTDGWPLVPCVICRQQVIDAVGPSGHPRPVDPVRVDGGKYTLVGTAGYKPQAKTPTRKLAFGVKYYAPHSRSAGTCNPTPPGGVR